MPHPPSPATPPMRTGPPLILQNRPCPVLDLRGAWHIQIPAGNDRDGRIPDGHLLHLVLRGDYDLEVSGQTFHPRAGDLIYYAADEPYHWLRNTVPVYFYSVLFRAPEIVVPPELRGARVISGADLLRDAFADVVATLATTRDWRRDLRAWQAMLGIADFWLRHMLPPPAERADRRNLTAPDDVWRFVESHIHSRRAYHLSLAEMAQLARCSRATVHRACLAATGRAPSRQLRHLRLEAARSLLLLTPMTIAAIAAELGYSRPQEFAREFTRETGRPPSSLRPDSHF